VSPQKLAAITIFGAGAGLAFQIVDDILNETGDSKALGKKAGSDRERGKMTYPAAVGLEKSKKEVARLTQKAVQALQPLGQKARPLAELAEYMAGRTT
jgi:geranylgeranyl pyrophosphate synthase